MNVRLPLQRGRGQLTQTSRWDLVRLCTCEVMFGPTTHGDRNIRWDFCIHCNIQQAEVPNDIRNLGNLLVRYHPCHLLSGFWILFELACI